MRQKALLAITLLMLSMSMMAQGEALAILNHEGTTKTFRGREALINAFAAAVNGDLITLSSGQFQSVSWIDKAVTIRGAGLGVDATYNTQPTVIYGNMNLAVNDASTTQSFQMEGIYHADWIYYVYNQQNVRFQKCRLGGITAGQYEVTGGEKKWGTCQNMQFVHCKIVNTLVCNSYSTMNLVNCYVETPLTYDESTSNISFRNCVITAAVKKYTLIGKSYNYDSNFNSKGCNIRGCYLTNCIVYKKGGSFESTWGDITVFTNCLLPSSWAPSIDRNTYQNYSSVSAIFKTYTGTYGETETFELKEDAAAAYLGNDGKEVGMYGGVLPYNPRLAGPHIKSIQVADRSTTDGKLSVKVEIDTTDN